MISERIYPGFDDHIDNIQDDYDVRDIKTVSNLSRLLDRERISKKGNQYYSERQIEYVQRRLNIKLIDGHIKPLKPVKIPKKSVKKKDFAVYKDGKKTIEYKAFVDKKTDKKVKVVIVERPPSTAKKTVDKNKITHYRNKKGKFVKYKHVMYEVKND